jgi:hypothetical protein
VTVAMLCTSGVRGCGHGDPLAPFKAAARQASALVEDGGRTSGEVTAQVGGADGQDRREQQDRRGEQGEPSQQGQPSQQGRPGQQGGAAVQVRLGEVERLLGRRDVPAAASLLAAVRADAADLNGPGEEALRQRIEALQRRWTVPSPRRRRRAGRPEAPTPATRRRSAGQDRSERWRQRRQWWRGWQGR